MIKHICLISGFIISLFSATGQEINGLSLRDGLVLDGEWKIIVDPYENGYYSYRWFPFDAEKNPSRSAFFMDSKAESPSDLIEYDFDKSKSLVVPGDWNTQMPELYYYEGTVWYRKKFDFVPTEDKKSFVYFDAVNYKAEVYLNGSKLGTHFGGFTPFWFDISEMIKPGSNSLILKVDNTRHKEAVPTLNTDWWNYGGITRKVRVIQTPESFVSDFNVQLKSKEDKVIEGYVKMSSKKAGQSLIISFPELEKNMKVETDNTGKAVFTLKMKNLKLWSPDNPVLYTVNIESAEDKIADKIGFRTIHTEGKKILLNGKEIFLRGISIHEELALNNEGRVNSPEKARKLLQWAKDLNCNFVRLAHYPHNEDMVRLADEMGILVWSEVPVYWTIDWKNPDTYQNAENQISEMIQRDKNRASVIIWSIANETPVKPERTEFLSKLATHVRGLDDTRLVSAAMERHNKPGDPSISVVQDPLAEVVDLVSFNQYTGWYGSTPNRCSEISWEIPYNKPVFVSEFGGGAKQGLHGDKHTRWTEEYQEFLYEENIKMLNQIDGLCGLSPWILVDFRSPRRTLPEIQDDFNRKGLISNDGIKKKAFFVLKEYYKSKM